jgi:hypothetical protein
MIPDSNLINKRDKSLKNQLKVDLAMDKKLSTIREELFTI